MTKKVGIPRGLFYFQYFPLWKIFFEELGAEVVVSGSTNKRILNDGVKICVDEACLPIKLFHGHVIDLKDKVDYIFIPRFTSIHKGEYICPKFGGLPDMVRNTINGLPEIIYTEINLRKNRSNSIKAAIEIGGYFTKDKDSILSAYKKAVSSYRDFRGKVKNGSLPGEFMNKKKNIPVRVSEDRLDIALIGHVYNLYDQYMNMDLIHKLSGMGVDITTIDMLDGKAVNVYPKGVHKKMFWSFGRKTMDGVAYLLENSKPDGIIYLMSFGCGIDSFVCDLTERRIRRNSEIPFMNLVLDEHSGEAGLDTRIEAFVDMLRLKSKKIINFD